MRLSNDQVWVELDDRFPRPLRMGRSNGGEMAGCEANIPFSLAINGQVFTDQDLNFTVGRGGYRVSIPRIGVTLLFAYTLEGQDLVLRIPEITETGALRVDEVDFPGLWLATGRQEWFWRHLTRRVNWSRHWCPGTATYDQWEDGGRIDSGQPELGPQYTNHACVWNDQICIGVGSSVHIEPLVTELSSDGARLHGRAGCFRIRPGQWSYRLRGTPAEPLVVRVGILDDYDGNGKVDMFDAANWEGDQVYGKAAPDPLYHEAIVYKLFVDAPNLDRPAYRYADVLPVIRDIHTISQGKKQILYLVGWQHAGHDTGYPCHTQLNPRIGTREELIQLIEEAKRYNCTVSLHANFDDSYREFPEHRPDLLSRDEHGEKVWFANGLTRSGVLSISHTLANESGYNTDRARRMLDLVPIRESVHFDAHRPYNEVWLPSGEHISAECEVQRGLIPIQGMFRAKGIDITTEDTDDEKRGIYRWVWIQPNWQHPYNTAMYHGRLPGLWRAGMPRGDEKTRAEGLALGIPLVKTEHPTDSYADIERYFYLYWMYAHLLRRKRMTGYWIADWNTAARATYEDNTQVWGGGQSLHATYEGIEIARNTDRFLPWRDDTIYAYSVNGGPQKWMLPASWEDKHIKAEMLLDGVAHPADIEVNGRTIRWQARPATPYRFCLR